uniref:Uncharacterized protein n=1 Tax=Panagrolaimus sp. JU765 TaxID=591449 RepID=A0AC34R990_9BILA
MGIGEELLQEIKQTPLIVHDESKSEPIGLNSGLDRNHHHLQSNILSGTNWAIITGSTDGIGKVYALELAKQGFDIILISRTKSRLEATKNEIIENYPKIKVEMIVFDFCQDDVKVYNSQLFDKLKKFDIGILVNNVGMAYDYPDILHEVHGGI